MGARLQPHTIEKSNQDSALRLHHFLPRSCANGPGVRSVIWVQGCTLGCPGCFNEPTHTKQGGNGLVTVDELVEQIKAQGDAIEGITISGGEPLQQLEPVTALIRRVKAETSLSVVLFTGFYWQELEQMAQAERRRNNNQQSPLHLQIPQDAPTSAKPSRKMMAQIGTGAAIEIELDGGELPLPVLEDVDVLIAGRYVQAEHLAQDLRGSANKTTYYLTEHYAPSDMQAVPPAEVTITPQGNIILSGINPLKINRQAQSTAITD